MDQGFCMLLDYCSTNMLINSVWVLLNWSYITDTVVFDRPGFPFPSADITCGFILFGPYCLDILLISPSDIHLHPRSTLNLSFHKASHPPAYYPWIFNWKALTTSQELLISKLTTNNSKSYIFLSTILTLASIGKQWRNLQVLIIGSQKCQHFGVKPWFYG